MLKKVKLKTLIDEMIFSINLFNPSRPDPGRKEKINLSFYFHTSFGASKGFMEALKCNTITTTKTKTIQTKVS